MKNLIDGYAQFFVHYPMDAFFEFGLENVISIDKQKVESGWEKLKDDIKEKRNANLYVRKSGANGNNNELLIRLHREIFGVEVNIDPNNNTEPARVIQNLTGWKKNKTIFNYQVSHVFGNTKNVYCFTAPWNIVFIPKILDPFTGHEAKGEYIEKFQLQFKQKLSKLFDKEIQDYNEIMKAVNPKLLDWIEANVNKKLRGSFIKDFQEIRF